MNNFFDYFNEDIGQVFQALWEAVVAFFNFLNYLFNFPMRMDKIKAHSPSFSTADWVMLVSYPTPQHSMMAVVGVSSASSPFKYSIMVFVIFYPFFNGKMLHLLPCSLFKCKNTRAFGCSWCHFLGFSILSTCVQ